MATNKDITPLRIKRLVNYVLEGHNVHNRPGKEHYIQIVERVPSPVYEGFLEELLNQKGKDSSKVIDYKCLVAKVVELEEALKRQAQQVTGIQSTVELPEEAQHEVCKQLHGIIKEAFRKKYESVDTIVFRDVALAGSFMSNGPEGILSKETNYGVEHFHIIASAVRSAMNYDPHLREQIEKLRAYSDKIGGNEGLLREFANGSVSVRARLADLEYAQAGDTAQIRTIKKPTEPGNGVHRGKKYGFFIMDPEAVCEIGESGEVYMLGKDSREAIPTGKKVTKEEAAQFSRRVSSHVMPFSYLIGSPNNPPSMVKHTLLPTLYPNK